MQLRRKINNKKVLWISNKEDLFKFKKITRNNSTIRIERLFVTAPAKC